jgi:LysM repeat protein
MLRKFFLLVLLVVFWIAIFIPMAAGSSGASAGSFFSSRVRPATRLPVPWQNKQRAVVQVNGLPSSGDTGLSESSTTIAAAEPVTVGTCGSEVIVSRGDALGKIASRCGLTLAELLALNPEINNPNRIYPGQRLTLVRSVRPDIGGGGEPAAVKVGIGPGGTLDIYLHSLPPNTRVRLGLGLSSSGFQPLDEAVTNAQGELHVRVRVPDSARRGEEGFILVTTQTQPAIQSISERFTVGW